MNPKYEIILYWSEDDQAFVAEVPELPGCMAHGDSQESALASVNEAITLWISTAEGLGRAVPTPKGRRLAYA
jgi:predicted RNase H-like HicB family nuclease